MKRWLALLALACGFAAPGAGAVEIRLQARETRRLECPRASAAFANDTSTVEASIVDGQLVLVGHRAGTTLVTVVMATSVETMQVRVDPAVSQIVLPDRAAARSSGTAQLRYDSGIDRLGGDVAVNLDDGHRNARLRVQTVYQKSAAGEGRKLALPSASLELAADGRSVVLLDEFVDATPLTLDGSVLRGVHLRDENTEIHAGVASETPWDDLLLPRHGDRAASIARRSTIAGIDIVPTLLWLPDSDTRVPGVLSVAAQRGSEFDPLQARAELGWSDKPGASFDLAIRNPQRQIWLEGAYRPSGFAALDIARPAGSYLDGAWSEWFGGRTNASVNLSASRLELDGRRPEAASAQADVRHQVSNHWTVSGGVGAGYYRDTDTPRLSRNTVSVGAAYDAERFGASAQYRQQRTSATDEAGHGGRVTLRASQGGLRANLYVDAQQNAPTLDLLLPENSDLARAFAELGFVATTPEDVVRQLRDHATLFAERGVTVGNLRFDPLRVQGGFNVSWQKAGPRRAQVGMRLLADEARGIADRRRTYLATVFGSWRVFGNTELELGYTRWATRSDSIARDDEGSFQIALRTSFSDFDLPGSGRRAISGRVVQESAGGAASNASALAGIEIVLDDRHRTRTDAEGRFVFDAPGPGEHRVTAMLAPSAGAYFTSASSVTVLPGQDARFGIAFAAARLGGTVLSDAGLPIAGVTVRLQGALDTSTVTDSSGAYRFAVPAGAAQVSIVADSVPTGYELGSLTTRSQHVAVGTPAVVDFQLAAQRSLQGVLRSAGGALTATAVEVNRSVETDAEGRFLLRGLPAGTLTLIARSARGEARRVLQIPAEPGRVDAGEIVVP
jgi:hypothetical protein